LLSARGERAAGVNGKLTYGVIVSPGRPQPPQQPEYADERDAAAFWREVGPRREPIRWRWFLPGVLALLVLSIPWYLPKDLVGGVVAGMPVWTWIALLCSVGVAGLTAWVGLRHWDDDV